MVERDEDVEVALQESSLAKTALLACPFLGAAYCAYLPVAGDFDTLNWPASVRRFIPPEQQD